MDGERYTGGACRRNGTVLPLRVQSTGAAASSTAAGYRVKYPDLALELRFVLHQAY